MSLSNATLAPPVGRRPWNPSSPDIITRRGTTLGLESVTRSFGSVVALDAMDLELAPGELVALLGPSGCGKTTALRIVAGMERADSGRVLVNGVDVSAKPANARDMGMVFQAYSLFPNLSVLGNVEYGLRVRKIAKPARRKRAGELLGLVGLESKAHAFPHELSGGQQQRVALARALAIEPTVLLLDEPLSALDAQVRTQIREEIRRIQLRVGITTLFVTHDQEEAMSIADRVGVMNKGRLEQIDSPHIVYARPASAFVAGFVGTMNRVPGVVSGPGTVEVLARCVAYQHTQLDPFAIKQRVDVLVRPEAISLARIEGATGAGQCGTVVTRSFLGPLSRVVVDVDGIGIVHADLPSAIAHDLIPEARVLVGLATNEVIVARRP